MFTRGNFDPTGVIYITEFDTTRADVHILCMIAFFCKIRTSNQYSITSCVKSKHPRHAYVMILP